MANETNSTLPLDEGQQQTQTPQVQQQTEQPKTEIAVAKTKESFTPALCAATISKIKSDPALAPLHGIANVFAKPFESFRKAFKDPQEADRVMAKEIDFAAQAMMANTYLIEVAKSNPLSLVNAIKNIALAGTTLSPVLKQAYLVPFTIKKVPTIVLFQSYMGEVSLLVNTGLVRKVEAHCVYKGDEFKITHGSKEELIHNPDCWATRSENTMLGAYYFVILTDGTEMFDFMNKEEIDRIKQRSPSTGIGRDGRPKQSPWTSDY
ncbi:MAG: recombinase RecT, partial [Muribaculaceae bacterium]|nr:recombinase RecT [Muribaculaceae bacterium]